MYVLVFRSRIVSGDDRVAASRRHGNVIKPGLFVALTKNTNINQIKLFINYL